MSTHDPGATRSQPKRHPWAVTCGDLSKIVDTRILQGVPMKHARNDKGLRDALPPQHRETLMRGAHV